MYRGLKVFRLLHPPHTRWGEGGWSALAPYFVRVNVKQSSIRGGGGWLDGLAAIGPHLIIILITRLLKVIIADGQVEGS